MSALVEPGQERLLLSSHGKAAPKVLQSEGRGGRGAVAALGTGLSAGLGWTQLGADRSPETPWEAGGSR